MSKKNKIPKDPLPLVLAGAGIVIVTFGLRKIIKRRSQKRNNKKDK